MAGAAETSTLEPQTGNGASRPPSEERDQSVSFAELVHAHTERQRELASGRIKPGPWELEYRRRLNAFRSEHGSFVDSYWCRFESSGVAITDRVERPARNLWRRESILRLHAATDWRTAHAPRIGQGRAWQQRRRQLALVQPCFFQPTDDQQHQIALIDRKMMLIGSLHYLLDEPLNP